VIHKKHSHNLFIVNQKLTDFQNSFTVRYPLLSLDKNRLMMCSTSSIYSCTCSVKELQKLANHKHHRNKCDEYVSKTTAVQIHLNAGSCKNA